MASQEIVDGLRHALSKGESLMQAMMSFYNAGYDKQEVEEAARMLNQPQQTITQQAQPLQPQQSANQKPGQQQAQQFSPGQPIQRVSAYGQSQSSAQQQIPQPMQQPQTTNQAPVQRVSNYGEKKPGSMVTVVLVIMLIILVALLVSLFLFRDIITDFFGGLLTRVLFNLV